jgi:hypothetical protein
MARVHGIVKTSIWTDQDFRALSAGAQRAYLMLLSQPQINNCGVLPYVPRRWAKMAPDDTPEAFASALDELAEKTFIVVDEDTEEVLVRTFIRHDRIASQPQLVKAALREFGEVESEPIRRVLFQQNQAVFEALPEPLRRGLAEPLDLPLMRARAGARTAPTPSPEGPLRSELPSGEEVSADTPGARAATPATAAQQAAPPPAPASRGRNGSSPTNLPQNGQVASDALAPYNAAARWLRSGGAFETDWRYRIEADFGVTDDIELAGLADLQEQLAVEVEA